MRKLDLDALDSVSGGLALHSLQTHVGAPGQPVYSGAPSFPGSPAPGSYDPFHTNGYYGGSGYGYDNGAAGAVPAGAHAVDPSHTYFDPFGPPGHPTGVTDPYHQGVNYPSLNNPYVYHQPTPALPGSQGPSINIPGIIGAVPGIVSALGSGNPAGAIPGIVNAIGGATGTNLSGVGNIINSLTQLGGSGGSGGGSNPFGAIGNLFGGGGSSGGQGGQGGDFGGGDFGGGDFGF